jgi:FMN phosphatase YigB (HAD superfamily)
LFLSEETDLIFQRLHTQFSPLADGIGFVHWAKKEGYRLVLATNPVWPLSVVAQRMQCSGLTPADFEFVTEPKTFCTTKPRIHFYEEIMQKLAANPSRVWMVGDHPRKDGSAKKRGIRVFIVNRAHESGSFAQLKKILIKENAR